MRILVLTFFAHIVLVLCLDENKPTTVVFIVIVAAAAAAAVIGDSDADEAVVDQRSRRVLLTQEFTGHPYAPIRRYREHPLHSLRAYCTNSNNAPVRYIVFFSTDWKSFRAVGADMQQKIVSQKNRFATLYTFQNS